MKILIGVTRPEWLTLCNSCQGHYILCGCGITLTTKEILFSHYLWGHFDINIYRDDIELESLNVGDSK